MIFIPVVEHTPTLKTFNVFVLFFPFVYLPFFSYIWPNWFSTLCSEWSGFNGSNFSTEMIFFFQKEKKIPGYKESLFVLNHFIYIFSSYNTCIIYIITLFRRKRSVRLIWLEKRSLSVGKNFGLAKTLPLHFLRTHSLHCKHSMELLPTPLQQTAQGYLPDFCPGQHWRQWTWFSSC